MRYYQLAGEGPARRVVAETDDAVYDLTSTHPGLRGFRDLARAASIAGESIDDIARRRIARAEEIAPEELAGDLSLPVRPDEVWAAGVTYEISERAREQESSMAEIYMNVYNAERPEVFFKATPSRTVGPDDAVGVRADSTWNAPEPELAAVLYHGEIIGYTIGNDVSSRDIEGANPLYLPQAKIYDRCCSVGPCVVSPESVGDPADLVMSMDILRDDETVFSDSTSTDKMIRSCEELAASYRNHNSIPETAVLMTGTALVPPDDFNLRAGDEVRIDIENIGTLVNPVVTV